MSELAEFLLARIAEDEEAARDAIGGHRSDAEGHWTIVSIPYEGSWPIDPSDDGYRDDDRECEEWTVHASRHDPARVLAECEAKRALVEDFEILHRDYGVTHDPATEARRFQARIAMARAAVIYADHPDYREEWRP